MSASWTVRTRTAWNAALVISDGVQARIEEDRADDARDASDLLTAVRCPACRAPPGRAAKLAADISGAPRNRLYDKNTGDG